MRWKTSLGLTALVVLSVHAVFIDDAFHVDYHQALLGVPQSHATFFHKPQSSSNASLLYTISDKSILGAVNPRDGALIWRQALADTSANHESKSYLAAGDADGRITSALGSTVSSFDALDGRVNWSYDLEPDLVVTDLQAVRSIGGPAENIVQDVVVLAGPKTGGSTAKLLRLAGDGSGPRWEYQDTSASQETTSSIATSPKHVYYLTKSAGILSGAKAKVVVVDIVTGKEITQYSVATDSQPLGAGTSFAVGSGTETPILLSSEKPFKFIKLNVLGNSKAANLAIDDKDEEIESLHVHYAAASETTSHFLIHVAGKTKQWAEVFHINAKTGDATKAYSLPATGEVSTFTATTVGPAVYFTRITASEVSIYSSESHGQLGRWPRSPRASEDKLQSLHAAAEVSSRGAGGIALRVALSSNVTGWSLIRNGEESWLRPEMLAYITKAAWAESVETESLVQEIETEATSNPMTAYVLRWTRHLAELRHLPRYLLGLPESIMQTGDEQGPTTREKLIGSKIVLVATSRGELFALNAVQKGAILWRTDLSRVAGSDAETVHLSVSESRLTAYLSNGMFVVVDAATGLVLESQRTSGSFGRVIELPGSPASTIVKVSTDGKPEVFSELAPAVPTEGSVVVTLNEQGEAVGWSIGSSVERIWTLRPETGSKFKDVIARPIHDPVASIGKVLGDRSVLYKYISPNTALATALSPTALKVYLINAVTGSVLHTSTHEGVLGDLPVAAVASGNWFAYSFTSRDPTTTGISSQIVVAELYESGLANDRGPLSARANYSSFSADAGAKPHVESRAFTIAEPLADLTISQTTQGITSRQLITYLSNSKSIIGIPLDVLNARRPVDRDPTASEAEEGLFRYAPVLELDPKIFLSHSREVLGIKKLMTAPTFLESTSIVFGYGHDVFGTQLAPSNTFDVLGKGFKRVQLILTVVALYAGVLFLRPLVRKKMVEQRWV